MFLVPLPPYEMQNHEFRNSTTNLTLTYTYKTHVNQSFRNKLGILNFLGIAGVHYQNFLTKSTQYIGY